MSSKWFSGPRKFEKKDLFNGVDKWSFQDIKLVPGPQHAVLYEYPLNKSPQLPKPRAGHHIWDEHHVRLPCSQENLFTDTNFFGAKVQKSKWDFIKLVLRKQIRSSQQLEQAIKTYNPSFANFWNFDAVHKLFAKSPNLDRYFFEVLLPKIINLALQLPKLINSPIPLLKQGTEMSISMSQQQASCLLANAFLCTFPRRNTTDKNAEYSNYPTINFSRLFDSREPHAVEKLKCLIAYFRRVCTDVPLNIITYKRQSLLTDKLHGMDARLCEIKCYVTSEGKIEDAHGMLQVDFANQFVGGGFLGNGCAQEEIRFGMYPEMVVAQLFTERLGPRDALVMIGCERFSDYSGFSTTFKWLEDFKDEIPLDKYGRKICRVVAMDAQNYTNNFNWQFTENSIRRDLLKAGAGFQGMNMNDNSPIASGLWGCGAFKGHPIRSALIQLMASSLFSRNLVIYTFGDAEIRNQIDELFDFLTKKEVTIAQLYGLLIAYRPVGGITDWNHLALYIKEKFHHFDNLSEV